MNPTPEKIRDLVFSYHMYMIVLSDQNIADRENKLAIWSRVLREDQTACGVVIFSDTSLAGCSSQRKATARNYASEFSSNEVFTIREGEWRVRLGNEVLPTVWNSKGAALAGMNTELIRRAKPAS